jgi:glucose-6-phosphate isomerase
MHSEASDAEFDHDVSVLAASRPFQVVLDFTTGLLTPSGGSFVRRLSDMASAYEDQEVVKRMLASGDDPVIYKSYCADVLHEPGHLAFLTTIITPGTVGSEFFMTKGHHHYRDSAELYLAMSGEGLMIMESHEGDFVQQELVPSALVYVPPGWAHRTVNTGSGRLTFMAAYFGDAGHDYASMESMGGFSIRVHRGDDGPQLRPSTSRDRVEGPR